MIRSLALLAALAGATAMELPANADWTFQADGGATWSMLPDKQESAQGNVQATYAGIRLGAERIDYQLIQLPGLAQATVASAILTPLPAPGSRVLLDSRAATLPGIPLRGIMTPARLTITRIDAPAAVVRWRIDLDDLGDADLLLTGGSAGPTWHHLWAQDAHLVVEAAIIDKTLGPMRLVDGTFLGRENPGDGSGRLARIDRFAPGPIQPPAGTPALGGVEAATILITVDTQDRPIISTQGPTRMHGSGPMDLSGRKP